MKTVKIFGKLYTPNGLPASQLTGVAILNQYTVDDKLIVPMTTEFKTDEEGSFEVDLWPNSRGSKFSRYIVKVSTYEETILDVVIHVPELDTPININDIILQPPYPPVNQALEALIKSQEAALKSINATEEVVILRDEILSLDTSASEHAKTSRDWAIKLDGLVDGEDHSSKYYALESKRYSDNIGTAAEDAENSASRAKASEDSASASAQVAITKASEASQSATQVATSESNAKTSETNAADSASEAEGYAESAEASATIATTKAEEASTSATNASTSANQSSTSATESKQSANLSKEWAVKLDSTVDGEEYSSKHYAQIAGQESQSASDSKNAAKQFADDSKAYSITSTEQATISTTKAGEASTSASNALASEQNSKTSEINSAISENNSAVSASNAKDSEDSSKISATNALNSANVSTTKANEASGYAIDAETSATTAAGKADDASRFADNAKASATTATNAASAASNSADNAAASETVASSKASAASASATTASDSATIATNKAGEALSSATAAANSASNAESSKSQAAAYASNAASSASSAESAKDDTHSYLNKAKDWASKEDTPVEGDEYSAKYWAKHAEAVSAVNFATETSLGISRFGTQEEVIDGVLDNVIVSPKYLKEVTDNKVDTSLIGAPEGIAPLGQDGKIPTPYLPSSVEQILEFDTISNFPEEGESDKIYVALDTNRVYRWGGSQYVEIASSPGSTDDVVEGVVNLYFTNSRAANAAPVQSVSGREGDVVLTKSDVGLGNVDNTSDINKPISSATQAALDEKVDKESGKSLISSTELQKLSGIESGAQVNLISVDNLTSDSATRPLSANQGKVLKSLIDGINTLLQSDDATLDELQEIVDFIKLNREDLDSLGISSIAGLEDALDGKQPLNSVLSETTASFTTTLKTKLDAIDTGATKNATDAQLRARSSHTGTQAISTIAGLDTALNAKADSASLGSIASADITISTGDPSGGVDGDIWCKVD